MFDEVDWAGLDHAYGSAADVPELLEAAAGSDEEAASRAIGSLWSSVGHQGSVYSASPPVVDIVLRLAADSDSKVRQDLVGLAAGLCRSSEFERLGVDLIAVARGEAEDTAAIDYAGGNWIPACRAAAATHLDEVLALLTDPAAAVRHAAAYLIPTLSDQAPRLLTALNEAVGTEDDAGVRASLTLAIAELSAAADHDAHTTTARLHSIMAAPDTPAIVRLAAALGHRWHTRLKLADEAVPALSAAAGSVSRDDLNACHWLGDAKLGAGGLVAFLLRLYPHDIGQVSDLATALLSASAAHIRRSAAVACLSLVRNTDQNEFGIATSSPLDGETARGLVTAAAATLTDTDAAVRRSTAAALTHIGRRSAWVRDALATATRDAEPRVAAWATAALANCGDPRAVDPLTRLLGEESCPWEGFDGTTFAMLRHMRPFAGRLDVALRAHFLGHDDESWWTVNNALLSGITGWGSDAAGLASAIWSRLMKGGCNPETAITALARIGPGAVIAAPDLKAWALEPDNDLRAVSAWAHWRITGLTHPALTTLRDLATTPPYPALDYLADMGPLARSAAPLVEPLLNEGYQWHRVQAAYTLWRITGQAEPAIPTLIDAAATLGTDRGYPLAAMWAIDRLAGVGIPAQAAIPLLNDILDDPDRLAEAEWPPHGDDDERAPAQVIQDALRRLRPPAP